MFGSYLVAIGAALFSSACALTWIATASHLDPPDAGAMPHGKSPKAAA